MRFFTTFEILNSILISILTGTFFGCVYSASESIFSAIRVMIYIPIDAHNRICTKNSLRQKNKEGNFKFHILKNILEALLFLFFGVGVILMLYLTLDGVFRFYVITIVAIFFILGKNTLGEPFRKIFDCVFKKIYLILYNVVYFIMLPIYKAFLFLKKHIIKLILPLKIKIVNFKSKKLIKKKKSTAVQIIIG